MACLLDIWRMDTSSATASWSRQRGQDFVYRYYHGLMNNYSLHHGYYQGLLTSSTLPTCRVSHMVWQAICHSVLVGGNVARATLDKKSCVITSTLFEMNFTCMRWCDLNFSCLSTSITSAEVSSCQDKRMYPNRIWPTVFTFRVFKHSFCEFMTMVSLHVHKST